MGPVVTHTRDINGTLAPAALIFTAGSILFIYFLLNGKNVATDGN